MPTVFFTDRDLGQKFPEMLIRAGLRVERHSDHFAHDTPDTTWIASVASRGWIGVTHDRAIWRRANEREAVLGAGMGLLVIVGAAPYPELAANFVRMIPRITSFLAKHRPHS